VAEDGVEEVTPALGGGIDALVAGVEEAGVEVKEAAKGVIIDIMPGAYFFAFSKKPSSSEKRSTMRRANLLPINLLAMRISKCNGPFGASLHRTPLHQQDRIFDGVEGCSKFLEVSSWHIRPFLWPQPDKHPL
jgi:hypothetical protein